MFYYRLNFVIYFYLFLPSHFQAVPTSSSSLRIMHKIKEAANLVITDLKKQCYSVLLSPTANYATLLRYGKIMSDLDGEGAYLELLRQCMIRQILHFVESVKSIRDKFCADCADANDNGLEQNLLRRSPFLAGILLFYVLKYALSFCMFVGLRDSAVF